MQGKVLGEVTGPPAEWMRASIGADLNHHVGLIFNAQSCTPVGCRGQVRISARLVKNLGRNHGSMVVNLPDRDTTHKHFVCVRVGVKIRAPLVVSIVVVFEVNDQE